MTDQIQNTNIPPEQQFRQPGAQDHGIRHYFKLHHIVGYALLGAIFLAIVAVAYWYQVSSSVEQNANTFTPVVHKDPTADWKTYTNDQYGFSFKYPPSFTIGPAKSDAQIGWGITTNNKSEISLANLIFVPISTAEASIILNGMKNPPADPNLAKPCDQLNYKNDLYQIAALSCHYDTESISVVISGPSQSMYVFGNYTDVTNLVPKNDLGQILSTFKFTSQNIQ